jgi:hypothetical protein
MAAAGGNDADEWYLDSAAARHMTTDLSVLSNMYTLPDPVEVTYANGQTGLATQAGTVTLQHGPTGHMLSLKTVLYAPCDAVEPVNLISVSKITSSGKATVTFTKDAGTITCASGFNVIAPQTGNGM